MLALDAPRHVTPPRSVPDIPRRRTARCAPGPPRGRRPISRSAACWPRSAGGSSAWSAATASPWTARSTTATPPMGWRWTPRRSPRSPAHRVVGRVATGPRAGHSVRRLGANATAPMVSAGGPRHAHREGFDLHGNVAGRAGDRRRREHRCRYVLRPPVAQAALEWTPESRVLLRLRRPWGDGTRAIRFEPGELLEKLAAMVSRPRVNLLISHGAFAARGCWRVARATATRTERSSARAAAGRLRPSPPRRLGRVAKPDLRPRRAGVPGLRRAPAPGGDHRRAARDRPHPRPSRAPAGAAVPRAAAPPELAVRRRELNTGPPPAPHARFPEIAPPPACVLRQPGGPAAAGSAAHRGLIHPCQRLAPPITGR